MAGKFLLIFASHILLFWGIANAQTPTRFLELGLSANAYRGDLSPSFDKWTSSFHLGLKLNHKERLNGHLNLMIGSITGENLNYTFTDSENPRPNNFFRTRLITVQYDLQFHFVKTERFMLYISQGIGLLRFSPYNAEGEDLLEKRATRAPNEVYSNISVMFPTNIGAAYFFPNHYGVGFQAGLLNPRTDYLDNVSMLSNNNRSDNVLMYKFIFYIPLTYDQ